MTKKFEKKFFEHFLQFQIIFPNFASETASSELASSELGVSQLQH